MMSAGLCSPGDVQPLGPREGLPANAGVAGSHFGAPIVNDFFIGAEYDGPCPPANVAPFVDHYLFTVYGLDMELNRPARRIFRPLRKPYIKR